MDPLAIDQGSFQDRCDVRVRVVAIRIACEIVVCQSTILSHSGSLILNWNECKV